jgi:hypothetical protein
MAYRLTRDICKISVLDWSTEWSTLWQVPKNPELGSDASRIQKKKQRKIDYAQPLTEDEVMEKEKLLTQVKEVSLDEFILITDINHCDS